MEHSSDASGCSKVLGPARLHRTPRTEPPEASTPSSYGTAESVGLEATEARDRQESPGEAAPRGAVGVSVLEAAGKGGRGNESSWKFGKDEK